MLQAQEEPERPRPRRSCQKSRDHMIIHHSHNKLGPCDWERPYVFVSETGKHKFLTPQESSWLPVHKFKLGGLVMSGSGRDLNSPQHKHDNRATFEFNATKISKRFPALCRISYFQHLGMRTFAMGTHIRLGANSPVKNLHNEILRMIGRYAGDY